MVDSLPRDVDGIHKYKILCEEDEWHNKVKDGRWYKMNSTKHKGYEGTRKFGVCQGSRICHNVHCSKLQLKAFVIRQQLAFMLKMDCTVAVHVGTMLFRLIVTARK